MGSKPNLAATFLVAHAHQTQSPKGMTSPLCSSTSAGRTSFTMLCKGGAQQSEPLFLGERNAGFRVCIEHGPPLGSSDVQPIQVICLLHAGMEHKPCSMAKPPMGLLGGRHAPRLN